MSSWATVAVCAARRSLIRARTSRRDGWTHVARLVSCRLGNRELLACGHTGRYFGSNTGDLMEVDSVQLKGARRRCKRCLGAWEQLELPFSGYHHADHHARVELA